MLIKQLIDLRKVRTENEDRSLRSSYGPYGWLVSNTVDDVYKVRLLKKSSNRKLKLVQSMLVTQYMAFKHRISFVTDLAANFGCDRFRIMPDIVSKLIFLLRDQ